MSVSSERVKKWRKHVKRKMIEAMGDKCICCDYEGCDEAMDFHHLDPTKKEFSFGAVRANPKKWVEIVEELKKCVLVCCRCHREIEHGKREVPTSIPTFNEQYGKIYATRMTIPPPERQCGSCEMMFFPDNNSRRYCSGVCSHFGRRKAKRPTKDELAVLITTIPYTTIGKQFLVSDNTIRKWAKQYELI